MLIFLIMFILVNIEISLYFLSSNKLIIRKMKVRFKCYKIRLVLKFFIDKDIIGFVI